MGHLCGTFKYAILARHKVGEVRVIDNVMEDLGVRIRLQRLRVLPGINSAIGVAGWVSKSDLRDQAWNVGKRWRQLVTKRLKLLVAHPLKVKVHNLYVHAFAPFGIYLKLWREG